MHIFYVVVVKLYPQDFELNCILKVRNELTSTLLHPYWPSVVMDKPVRDLLSLKIQKMHFNQHWLLFVFHRKAVQLKWAEMSFI